MNREARAFLAVCVLYAGFWAAWAHALIALL